MADIILVWLLVIWYIMTLVWAFKLNAYCFVIWLIINTIVAGASLILYLHERDKKWN